MAGVVYILTNVAMPGIVKIGTTDGNIEDRVRGLDNTSVPLPFDCFYAAQVAEPWRVEKAIHEAFGDNRIRKSREFFRISPDKPKAIVELLCQRNMALSQDISGEADNQEVRNEERKRRTNFRFSLIGIKPGTKLQSVFDDKLTCRVRNDRRVEFRNEEHSLSSSALIIAREKGHGWAAIPGPQYWKYIGKTLAELRDGIAHEE